jgi:hypothetical protein
MAICTAIESARYANDVGITLRTACLALISEAEAEPLSDDELSNEMAQITVPNSRLQWKSKFLCVRATLAIPYVGNADQIVHDYRQWRADRKTRLNSNGSAQFRST